MTADTPLSDLGRYGKALASRFKRVGLRTCGDLLMYPPHRYDDFSEAVTVAAALPGQSATIRATVELIANRRSPVKRTVLTEALLSDDSGKMTAVWFKQPYIAKVLKPGTAYAFAGKVSNEYGRKHLVNPVYELAADAVHTGRRVPVYPTTEGLTQKHIRAMVHAALPALPTVVDTLPDELQRQHQLVPLASALRELHYPSSNAALDEARRRLQFDELLFHQLVALRMKNEVAKNPAVPVIFNDDVVKEFVGSLPFKLTDDQRKAAFVILRDLEKREPMHRLLDGDVGSGKTIVAAIAAVNVAHAGGQTAIMAPTEVLAKQHFESFKKFVPNKPIALLTNAYQLAVKDGRVLELGSEDLAEAILQNEYQIVIGTHALLEEKVRMPKLTLAVVDEQHRFGVEQRKELQSKRSDGMLPHLLSMTATPIPRTLQLALYGDLDISLLKTKPADRLPIETSVAGAEGRDGVYEAVRTELEKGRQAFVVCPLIDPSDTYGAKSATALAEELQKKRFADRRVGLLHGRLKAKEKEEVMRDFLEKKIDILVATAVIEVGIDVPNATVMVLEGAERFGLAQLHQFRGRVGRSSHQSYCYAIAEAAAVPARLKAFAQSNDGFELAERDLELRGPGELFGVRQSGVEEMRFATLMDAVLLEEAQKVARQILETDPNLGGLPELKRLLERHEERVHLE